MIRKLMIRLLVNVSEELFYFFKSYFYELIHEAEYQRYCKSGDLPF